jgi:hypothetical protein
MDKRTELIESFGIFQLTTDEFRKQDVPYIPNWNYELLADFILAREAAKDAKIEKLKALRFETLACKCGESAILSGPGEKCYGCIKADLEQANKRIAYAVEALKATQDDRPLGEWARMVDADYRDFAIDKAIKILEGANDAKY